MSHRAMQEKGTNQKIVEKETVRISGEEGEDKIRKCEWGKVGNC